MGISNRSGLIGQTIDGRYQVTGIIGEGGMGTVYRAQHTRIGRPVAIKCLHVEYAANQQALQGFFDEARAAATLNHPNIAEATDMGELKDGSPYLVLELLDGRSLHDEIDYVGRLSVRRSLRIARQIAQGVKAAHDAGIIHRDLKSDNVFLIERDKNPDHVKIFDFGVARILGQQLTRPGQIVGTPEFMPPEQMTDPDSIDARADVYAVGAILYHMLSGKVPYGETALPAAELLQKILAELPQPITGVPEDIRVMVEAAMARDRDDRIGSMSELLTRIDQIVLPGQSSPSIQMPVIPRRNKSGEGVAVPLSAAAEPQSVAKVPSPRWHRVLLVAGAVVTGCIGAYFIVQTLKAPSVPATPPTLAPAQPAQPTQRTNLASADPAVDPSSPPVRVVGRPHDVGSAAAVTPPVDATVTSQPTHSTPHLQPHPVPAAHPRKPDKIGTAPATPSTPEPDVKGVDPRPPAVTKPAEPTKPPVTTPVAPVSGPKPGTIDVVATQTAIRPHLGSIQRCYERAKMDDLSLAGSVTVRISIGPDGSVTNAAVAKSTLGSPAAEHCITQEISSWHLPEPSGGVASSLIYPFVFE